jgi:iron complex transport system ATP-binding protein
MMMRRIRPEGLIEVDRVSYSYAAKAAVDEVSLSIAAGAVVALLGPNGSGKTTLLKLMLGLIQPDGGEVRLAGRALAAYGAKELARRLAYVPQVHRMAFGYRVLDVVLMGRVPHKGLLVNFNKADEELARAALRRLSIDHLEERCYTEISGGERQLVLIARALTQGADILIMDEPVNGLDYGNQIRLFDTIAELAEQGYTFIKTTHYPDHALWVADRVVMLQQGRIIADGSSADVINRENLFHLYRADVAVCTLLGKRVCVPETLRGKLPSKLAVVDKKPRKCRAVG